MPFLSAPFLPQASFHLTHPTCSLQLTEQNRQLTAELDARQSTVSSSLVPTDASALAQARDREAKLRAKVAQLTAQVQALAGDQDVVTLRGRVEDLDRALTAMRATTESLRAARNEDRDEKLKLHERLRALEVRGWS